MAEFMQSKMTVIQPDGTILGSPESLEKYWDEALIFYFLYHFLEIFQFIHF